MSTEDPHGMRKTLAASAQKTGEPFDVFTVNAYTDWLLEQGHDELAEAYRAVTALGVRPWNPEAFPNEWHWAGEGFNTDFRSRLSDQMVCLLGGRVYTTLEKAVLALGKALREHPWLTSPQLR